MPQIFQVLRCFKCMVFQVHQTKKSNKWACKLCGEKQSVKRHYGLGTAKDCRLHVQRLNGMRGEIDESKAAVDDEISTSISSTESEEHDTLNTKETSKWSNFLEEAEETAEVSPTNITNNTMDGLEVVLEVPKKKKKVVNKNENCFTVPSYESKLSVKNSELPYCNLKRDITSNIIATHNDFVENKEVKIEAIADIRERKPKVEETLVKKNTELKTPSKWNQYVEDGEDNIYEGEKINNESHKESKNSNVNGIGNSDYKGITFSLCDDQDIDQVLDF